LDGDSPAGVTVRRPGPPRPGDHGVNPHSDIAYVKRIQTDGGMAPAAGWSSTAGSATPRRRLSRRLGSILLLLPLVVGLLGAPASPPGVKGDELSDAKARAAQLKKEVAQQKAQVANLNALQGALSAEIKNTTDELRGINADLKKVRIKIDDMQTRIDVIKADYEDLVAQVKSLDAQLVVVTAREVAKKAQLVERKALLSDRVRSAYDTDRTSLLESFLSGGTFTDLLAEMSYYIDVGEQDKALALQIVQDQETLASLHQTTVDTRTRTNELRQETAAQKRALDASLAALVVAKAELKKLEKRTAATLAAQKRTYERLARNKAAAAAIIRAAAAKQKRLAKKIDELIQKQVNRGNIPSEFNGSMRWPEDNFTISGEYGCSSFEYYAPGNGCAHYHNGIDLVGPSNARVRAAAAGTVVYVGWNWADGPDPAWIVVIAHSGNVRTWYAHMQPTRPVSVGQHVSKGQVIGIQGSTGHATGAHLHWMVELNGTFVNPRLFL
jgi:murein DD-endopeptidase MepM/ murein hydrolase activator NlpD